MKNRTCTGDAMLKLYRLSRTTLLFALLCLAGGSLLSSFALAQENDARKDAEMQKSQELRERVATYKFIIESIGFQLKELIIDPDEDGLFELQFEGKISLSEDKFAELAEKYHDEKKLFLVLEQIYAYNANSLENFMPYKIVVHLSAPPRIKTYFKKYE